MAKLIRNGRIVLDNWQQPDSLEAIRSMLSRPDAAAAKLLVPASLWPTCREWILAAKLEFGLLVRGEDDPARFDEELAGLSLVAVHIARFTDGRAYSAARLLRGRFGYRGELRAVGDVLVDQLYYLMRVGFDAFALRQDQNPQLALSALRSFGANYQASSDQPVPLFKRRAASA
jgi:uncharacterized protein (DUF934 family)